MCHTENDPMTTIFRNLSINQWSIPIKKIMGQEMTCDKRIFSWSSYLNTRNYYLVHANSITIYGMLPNMFFFMAWQKDCSGHLQLSFAATCPRVSWSRDLFYKLASQAVIFPLLINRPCLCLLFFLNFVLVCAERKLVIC